MIIKLILISALFLLSGCATHQARWEKAKQSFEEQNYRLAYQRLKPLAEKGMPDAQYALGYLYYYGLGVVENRPLGKQLIERAAQGGSLQARRALEVMY